MKGEMRQKSLCLPVALFLFFSFIANKLSRAGGTGRLMAFLSQLYTPISSRLVKDTHVYKHKHFHTETHTHH